MRRHMGKRIIQVCVLALFLAAACPCCLPHPAEVHAAAKNGFYKSGGNTYYRRNGVNLKGWQTIKGNTYYFSTETGAMATGWRKDGEGNRYYFDKETGVMYKGWYYDRTTKVRKYYFSKTDGRMFTGWKRDENGKKVYFDKNTGVIATGLKKIGKYYYFFKKANGVLYQGGFKTISGKKYYFSPADGRAHTGWLTLNDKKYCFDSSGVMYADTTVTIDGQSCTFGPDGALVRELKYSYVPAGNALRVTDNGRTYMVAREFAEHPGVADGTASDLDILAALCDSEAGDQGRVGMIAVALCILNRTIKPDHEFPSEIRYVIYQWTNSFAQYSVVTNGALLRRLSGNYESAKAKEDAYYAARKAMAKFSNYVKNGKPRTLSGFKKVRPDFDYMYFMMTSSFWNQPLDFSRVEYYTYKDHTFFVDWV